MKIAENIGHTIGRTPLVCLERLTDGLGAKVLGMLESFNPAANVKDRIGRRMIEAVEADGRVKPGATIIEPNSGNTGIALAMIAASRGYRLILTMPDLFANPANPEIHRKTTAQEIWDDTDGRDVYFRCQILIERNSLDNSSGPSLMFWQHSVLPGDFGPPVDIVVRR